MTRVQLVIRTRRSISEIANQVLTTKLGMQRVENWLSVDYVPYGFYYADKHKVVEYLIHLILNSYQLHRIGGEANIGIYALDPEVEDINTFLHKGFIALIKRHVDIEIVDALSTLLASDDYKFYRIVLEIVIEDLQFELRKGE